MPDEQIIWTMNDLGYELPTGALDHEDPVALSDFLESMLEKAR